MMDFEPIAIIGRGCILPPHSCSPEELWDAIVEGRSGIHPPMPERWGTRVDYVDPDRNAVDRTYCGIGGFVTDYDQDERAASSERMRLNRTQRMIVDSASQAIGEAGIDRSERARCRLFVGNMLADEAFGDQSLSEISGDVLDECVNEFGADARDAARRAIDDVILSRNDASETANAPSDLARIPAEVLGMPDDPIVIDGACASGLLIVDLAARYLHTRAKPLAMAVGAMANMSITGNVSFAKIGGLSDKPARPLDANANGLVPAEGAAAVLLCTLSYARLHGYPISGVIIGSYTTSDGHGKAIYAPNPEGQRCAMRGALAQAGIDPDGIDYIETHATGTPAGDNSELTAIIGMLSERRNGPVSIGSIKNLIGHGFPTAGTSNLLSVLESFRHERYLPTHGVTTPHPLIAKHPELLQLHDAPDPWPEPGNRPRRALINAFGFGGINSSVIVEQYDDGRPDGPAHADAEPRDATYLAVQCVAQANCEVPRTLLEDPMTADWRVFHTPPVLLPHMDIAQRLAVLAAGNLQPMMAEPDRKETIGAFLGQPSGLAVGARRELRIRLPEILDAITHAEIPDERRRELRRWFADRVTTSIGATVEAALPGYMDNIVSGRIANMFDYRRPNCVIDGGRFSFARSIEMASLVLAEHEADGMIVGSSFANPSHLVDQEAARLATATLIMLRPLDWAEAHREQVRAVIRISHADRPGTEPQTLLDAARLAQAVTGHASRMPRLQAGGMLVEVMDPDAMPSERIGHRPDGLRADPGTDAGHGPSDGVTVHDTWIGVRGATIPDCLDTLLDGTEPVQPDGQATPIRIIITFDSPAEKENTMRELRILKDALRHHR
ncbi:polyketide synthase [Bifidobacterium breve]|uniref:beta-ketoacyl [acyl carrier protein] synthase domain-containing protein n=1 Tax=Bifidobacterium breve TaxID=1685 RepID=UPI000CA2B69D|nr:polyketide synthase [Bifidobacterium breve]AUD98353.1 Multi-domain protein [Bifidobacterium breve]